MAQDYVPPWHWGSSVTWWESGCVDSGWVVYGSHCRVLHTCPLHQPPWRPQVSMPWLRKLPSPLVLYLANGLFLLPVPQNGPSSSFSPYWLVCPSHLSAATPFFPLPALTYFYPDLYLQPQPLSSASDSSTCLIQWFSTMAAQKNYPSCFPKIPVPGPHTRLPGSECLRWGLEVCSF